MKGEQESLPTLPEGTTIDIHQLTTLEAFGVNLPSLMLSPMQSQDSLDSKTPETYNSPNRSRQQQRRRSQSMIEHKLNASKLDMLQVEKNIEQVLKSASMSNEDIPFGGENASRHYRKSILKNSQVIASHDNLPKQTTVDNTIIVDYGGDVVQHTAAPVPSNPSIMSKLAGKEEDNIYLADSVKESLARELPIFEALLTNNMIPRVYEQSAFIIRKHDIGNEMYFLSKGKVEILSSDSKSQYGIINAASFFGMKFLKI